MDHGQSETWLQDYLVLAVGEDLCTQLDCTTCGATRFRLGLLGAAMPGAKHSRPRGPFDTNEAQKIVEALTKVRPPENSTSALEEAVHFLLFHSAKVLGKRTLDDRLEGTWAAEALRRMQQNLLQRDASAARHAELNDPDKVRARREEKKKQRAASHAARLEAKKERDRIWRVSNPNNETRD